MKIRNFILPVLMLSSSIALAGSGWTGYGTVKEIYPEKGGIVYARLSLINNPSGCNSPWFTLEGPGDGIDRVYSALLLAFTTTNEIRVYVTGECDTWGYSKFTSASVKK